MRETGNKLRVGGMRVLSKVMLLINRWTRILLDVERFSRCRRLTGGGEGGESANEPLKSNTRSPAARVSFSAR
jgi:hypothetical protein